MLRHLVRIYGQLLVLTYTPTLILVEPHDVGTATATSREMTRFEQMPRVVSGIDTSRLVEIIITHRIFLYFTCENMRGTMHGVPRVCEVIIELYHTSEF